MNIEIKKTTNLVNYHEALIFQENRVEQIINGSAKEMLWFLEHDHIYTAGSGAENKDIVDVNIPIINTNRGGKHTYHGPGQRIIYLMLDLKKIFHPHPPDIRKFIERIENWIIATLQSMGINCNTNPINHGVWIGNNKIAAMGIKLRKWISYHGIAINVSTDLDYYQKIIPCGVSGYGVTSLHNEKYYIEMRELDKLLLDRLESDLFATDN